MKGAACGFALVLLASCGETTGSAEAASSDRSDRPKKFLALMETAQEEVRALKDDVSGKHGGDAAPARLAAVRKNIASARAIPHPKYEKKQAELDAAFGLFLDRALKELEEAAWDESNGLTLWKKLLGACASCHRQYRD